jgi:hypothetical protein
MKYICVILALLFPAYSLASTSAQLECVFRTVEVDVPVDEVVSEEIACRRPIVRLGKAVVRGGVVIVKGAVRGTTHVIRGVVRGARNLAERNTYQVTVTTTNGTVVFKRTAQTEQLLRARMWAQRVDGRLDLYYVDADGYRFIPNHEIVEIEIEKVQ